MRHTVVLFRQDHGRDSKLLLEYCASLGFRSTYWLHFTVHYIARLKYRDCTVFAVLDFADGSTRVIDIDRWQARLAGLYCTWRH